MTTIALVLALSALTAAPGEDRPRRYNQPQRLFNHSDPDHCEGMGDVALKRASEWVQRWPAGGRPQVIVTTANRSSLWFVSLLDIEMTVDGRVYERQQIDISPFSCLATGLLPCALAVMPVWLPPSACLAALAPCIAMPGLGGLRTIAILMVAIPLLPLLIPIGIMMGALQSSAERATSGIVVDLLAEAAEDRAARARGDMRY